MLTPFLNGNYSLPFRFYFDSFLGHRLSQTSLLATLHDL